MRVGQQFGEGLSPFRFHLRLPPGNRAFFVVCNERQRGLAR